jgi:hypothetical protein
MKRLLLALLFTLWSPLAHAGVPCSVPNVFLNNTIADANQVNANFTAVLDCLLNAALAGANSDITSLNALSTPLTPSQGGSNIYVGAISTGTANAQVIGVTTPTGFALARGSGVLFIAGFTNTGPLTLAVNGTTATNVFQPSPSGPNALIGGEVIAGNLTWAVYDGTQFQLMSSGAQFGGYGATVTLPSAATVDLGTIGSHSVAISGNTAITSFGATAIPAFPFYVITFTGTSVITYNQMACGTTGGCILTPGAANIQAAPGDFAIAQFLGKSSGGGGNWQIAFYQRVSGTAVTNATPQCGFSGLTITTVTTVTASWAWNSATLVNTAQGTAFYNGANSGTLNITTPGVINGLDTGGVTANTWYYIWGISDGVTTGVIATASPPPTLPILPTGYKYACYAGAVKTGTGAVFYGTKQIGNEARYVLGGMLLTTALPILASGGGGGGCNSTTPTWAPQTVRGTFVPFTATLLDLIASVGTGATGTLAIAPTTSYPGTGWFMIQSTAANTLLFANPMRMFLEANSIQYCDTSLTGTVTASGWKDGVNAN